MLKQVQGLRLISEMLTHQRTPLASQQTKVRQAGKWRYNQRQTRDKGERAGMTQWQF